MINLNTLNKINMWKSLKLGFVLTIDFTDGSKSKATFMKTKFYFIYLENIFI